METTRYFAIMTFHEDAITFAAADLPGFFVQAETTDAMAAIAEAEEVLADYTGTLQQQGRDLPAPSDFVAAARIAREKGMVDADGPRTASVVLTARPRVGEPVRINISLDTTVLAKIDEAAKARGMTRSAYLAAAALAYD